jgi:hypothetical protein
MSGDDLTRPERAAQIRQAKRYKSAIDKEGRCCACKHRDMGETFFGRRVCKIGQQRIYPQCNNDGKGLRFEFDDSVLPRFSDRAA